MSKKSVPAESKKTKSAKAPKAKKAPSKKPLAKEAAEVRGRPGPKPKPKSELARNCVAVHMTDAEHKALKTHAAGAKLGAVAREIVVKSLAARKLL